MSTKLFAINADYRPWNKGHNWYYVVASNAREAKKIFGDKISWLDIYIVEEVTDDELIHRILTRPYNYIVLR